MGLTSDNELAIRKALAVKIAVVPESGAVIPAPVFFADRGDFWAQINALAVNTQKQIETANLAFCSISLLKRVDSIKEGCADNPFIRLTYNFYFFRGYAAERADESVAPDEFLRRNLKSYNTFVKAVLDCWTQFIGIQAIGGLPSGVEANSNPLTQAEFINELEKCRYVRRGEVEGHAVNLQLVAEVSIRDEN